jgi:MFS transporter, PHS family, inorganic phosphate transporter
MQIFALFMLCGTIVSFLLPETKGRTLEELAGEASTPLDIRNGSVTLSNGFRGWWARSGPFSGGKPAGFNYVKSPNLGPKSPGIRGKRERLGIMTSPELLPKKWEKAGKSHGRAMSESSANGSGSVSSTGGHAAARRTDENDDLYLAGAGEALPGWGAGWSAQQNNVGGRTANGRVESIMLNDVGRPIKIASVRTREQVELWRH